MRIIHYHSVWVCLLLFSVALNLITNTAGEMAWASDDRLDEFNDGLPEANDNLIDGFEDSNTAKERDPRDPQPKLGTTMLVRPSGHVKAAASYNLAHNAPATGDTDWRGLSRLKPELLLKLDVKPAADWRAFASGMAGYDFAYGINGRDNYTDAVLDECESEMELRELYLQGSLARQWDIKVGRQIVVWGTSDNIRVVDAINPLDLREPGITDIEDLRLPVTLTKLDYYRGPFNLSGMAIHEVRFNRTPPYGSDFYPYAQPPPIEETPGSNLSNTQFAIALTGIFSGWDIGIYWADLYSTDTYVETPPPGSPLPMHQKHARVKMLGASLNVALGNWLIKGEVAWFDRLKFTNAPHQTYSRLDVMAGVEYSGFEDTQITLEIADRHLFDYDSELKQDPDGCNANQLHWVVRIDSYFMNDTLTLTLLVSAFGEKWQDGAYQRLSAEYEITDAFVIDGGVVFYQSGNLPAFKNVGDNDRLFLEIKYSF